MKFKNEPFSDFSNAERRRALEQALRQARRALGRVYPLVVDGRRLLSRRTLRSINPSRFSEVIGLAPDAGLAPADRALEAATRAFESWRRVSQEKRAGFLRRMAGLLRRRRFEFCAWLILEVGKNWAEADADVAEAIDFLEYYAELSLLPPPRLTPVPSEHNVYLYEPLGPVVVIPPWNFPLAILVGMTSAALVTGNTVVLKPSSQSPVIAAKFVELAEEAGLPAGVINWVAGAGRSIGNFLVKDPRTRLVAFTGSRAVGLQIHARAARAVPNQRWMKRVIAEMGGKNAILVDGSADIEAAVQGVLASAFGYQGQKCSACSRAYIHADVYEPFVERLIQQVRQIRIGPAEAYENGMGPVISEDARRGILKYMALGRRQGRLLYGGGTAKPDEGFFLQPTLFDRLPETSPLWTEEIFGPVLALREMGAFEKGLELANATDYGLTGAVFSNDPAHLDLARREFFCGNLYLNRKCTGALVGGHPFGGFNMSGTDSKAGGPDYLLLFRQAKAVSQKR